MTSIPPHDTLLILDDAVSGVDTSGFEGVIGKFGSGDLNDNSIRFLSFCASTGLSVAVSRFRQRDCYR